MESTTAKNSPTRKSLDGTRERNVRLAAFAGTVDEPSLTGEEMREAAGERLWDGYWAKLDEIGQLMDRAQEDASKICAALERKYNAKVGQ